MAKKTTKADTKSKKDKAKPKGKPDRGRQEKGKVFGGLHKDRYEKRARGADRLELQQGDSAVVQFVAPITDEKFWKEIDQHQFQDKGWRYVPCLGEGCPLCDDDDKDVAKTTYRFFTVVWDFKEKRLAVAEGPKDLSGRIGRRYEGLKKKGKEDTFLKKTYLVSKNKTTPVSYDIETDDKKPVKIDLSKAPDLDAYIEDQKVRYFGEDLPKATKKKGKGKKGQKTALDDDAAEDDELTKDELNDLSDKKLTAYAKEVGIKKPDVSDRKGLIKQILKKQ